MRLLIIDSPNSWHVNDMIRAAPPNCTIESATYVQLSATVAADGDSEYFAAGVNVVQFDAIFTRAMPAATLEQIVFRMDWLQQVEHQLKIPVINSARTIEASVDKYLSLEKLKKYSLPIPATNVTQSAATAFECFKEMGCDSVVKPIFGSRGRGIVRLQDANAAQEKFCQLEQQGSIIYQQQFIEHGDSDLRILVIGDQVFAMRRVRPGQWITNASLGASCFSHSTNDCEESLAITAAHSQGAMIAGVDIVYHDQQPVIVEVNACPAWKNLAATTQTDISGEVLSLIGSLSR